ncbi:MAG: phosphatase PAP2 family protein [Chitinophagaceae bacterium]|nr:MAG: phosphatase PAP2 family protein [Chitinophagaceae bacterium]
MTRPTYKCLLVPFVILLLVVSCRPDTKAFDVDNVEILHRNEDLLTRIIIYDVFTPPVAARIYVYSSLASYEALRFSKDGTGSIMEKTRGFAKAPLPEPRKNYNFLLAASKAFFTVARNIRVFAVDSLQRYEDSIYTGFREHLDDSTYQRSVAFGDTIARVVLARAKTDGYVKSRGKPKHLGSNDAGMWRPTPPDYLDGVEWCWNTMKTFVLDSASQFMAPPPPVYSSDTNSVFFKNVKEVYNINLHLTDEQKLVARYWDDNPFVIEHSGHLSFGNKKITPGGHWMGIAAIAARKTKADAILVAKGYVLTAIALYDGFIACWDEKYRSNYIRPVTVINEFIDPTWTAFLQTPPFPEYVSGHSTITRAAATVLSRLYGDHFSFLDTSDLEYIGLQREFGSFVEAADEASISRVYGGIHYTISVDEGAVMGKKVGDLIVDKLMK